MGEGPVAQPVSRPENPIELNSFFKYAVVIVSCVYGQAIEHSSFINVLLLPISTADSLIYKLIMEGRVLLRNQVKKVKCEQNVNMSWNLIFQLRGRDQDEQLAGEKEVTRCFWCFSMSDDFAHARLAPETRLVHLNLGGEKERWRQSLLGADGIGQ